MVMTGTPLCVFLDICLLQAEQTGIVFGFLRKCDRGSPTCAVPVCVRALEQVAAI